MRSRPPRAKAPHWVTELEVAAATVRVPGGMGVLVPGGYVLTAASLLSPGARSASVTVTVACGTRLALQPVTLELVDDIAVLGPRRLASNRAFARWSEGTIPVPLHFNVASTLDVRTLMNGRTWVGGTATRLYRPGSARPPGSATLETRSPVRYGSAGGPVVDEVGRLVGVLTSNGRMAVCRWPSDSRARSRTTRSCSIASTGLMPVACRWSRIAPVGNPCSCTAVSKK